MKIAPIIFILLILLITPFVISAQSINSTGVNNARTLPNPLGPNGPADLAAFVFKALQVLAQVGYVIIVVCFVYCGFLFVVAQGNEEKLTKAKRAFLYTVIGTAILLGSTVIVTIIKTTISQI